jgi:hypothetical protein
MLHRAAERKRLFALFVAAAVVGTSAAASAAAGGPVRVIARSKAEWVSEMRASARSGDRDARFPSPSRTVLLARLRTAARLYGFQIVTVQMLHPLQGAPAIVIRSDRQQAIALATRKIVSLFNPYHPTSADPAGSAYEGYFLVAEDSHRVPYLASWNESRALERVACPSCRRRRVGRERELVPLPTRIGLQIEVVRSVAVKFAVLIAALLAGGYSGSTLHLVSADAARARAGAVHAHWQHDAVHFPPARFVPGPGTRIVDGPRLIMSAHDPLLGRLARYYGFRLVSFRYLALDQAAAVIVRTGRLLTAFAADVSVIERAIDPIRHGGFSYRAFFFEAEDEHGVPFLATQHSIASARGQLEGEQWARGPTLYPFPHG